MKRTITSIFLILIITTSLIAQNIPDSRKVDWSICGYEGNTPCASVLRNAVTEFGVNNSGSIDVTAKVNAALNTINDDEVLYFPAGTYLFNGQILVPAHRVIRGESPSTTIFNFSFSGTNNCIGIKGSSSPVLETTITSIGAFGEYTVTVSNISGLSVGDDIELEQENDPSIHGAEDPNDLASWAENLKGQLAKIAAINGNVITLDRSLVFDYDINFNMNLRKLNLIEQVGLENFKLVRLTNNGIGSGNNNIWFSYAKNCWVRKLHLEYSSRYHFQIDHARNVEVNEVFMDKAYSCGGGGAGYGLLLQDHVSECLFENNIARSLRHPWIPKEGCARNVYAYNFSFGTTQGDACNADPLSDSYADISLHGHYPAFNLFEGNIVYRIASSDAWGPNGPGNTFFRNRVLGQKGIWIQSYSLSQNVIGNELTHPSAQFEMDRDNTIGTTTLHYSNYNSIGLIDALAPNPIEKSLYRTTKPDYFGNTTWPSIGPDVTFNSGQIPAQIRYNTGNYFTDSPVCAACGVPNLGIDQSICGLSNITLNSQLNSDNRSFQWFRDNQNLNKSTSSITINQAGNYVVKADSAGCITEDKITISATIGSLDLGGDQILCNPSIITLKANLVGNGLNYSWYRNNELLEGLSSSTYSTFEAGTYKLEVSASGCSTVSDEVTITSDLLPVLGDSICVAGDATLEVLQAGNYKWYNQLEGGLVIETGNTVMFNVNNNTVFYVEDADGVSAYVGMKAPDLTNNRTFKDDRFDRKLTFTVLSNLTLDSLSIWSNTATAVTVRILTSDNVTVLFSKSFNNITLESENRLGLDVDLVPGDYYLDFVGTNGKLYHSNENDLGISYPYTVSDFISITGAEPAWVTAKPYYMFGYNWKVTAGNACARTPVEVIVDATMDKCLVTSSKNNVRIENQLVYPNPSNNGFRMNNTQPVELTIYAITGTVIDSINLNAKGVFGEELDVGTYFIQVKNGDEVDTFKIIKY